jgi:hypothetical protein
VAVRACLQATRATSLRKFDSTSSVEGISSDSHWCCAGVYFAKFRQTCCQRSAGRAAATHSNSRMDWVSWSAVFAEDRSCMSGFVAAGLVPFYGNGPGIFPYGVRFKFRFKTKDESKDCPLDAYRVVGPLRNQNRNQNQRQNQSQSQRRRLSPRLAPTGETIASQAHVCIMAPTAVP